MKLSDLLDQIRYEYGDVRLSRAAELLRKTLQDFEIEVKKVNQRNNKKGV